MRTNGVVDDTCMGYRARVESCTPAHTCVNCVFFFVCETVTQHPVYHISDWQRLAPASNGTIQDWTHVLMQVS